LIVSIACSSVRFEERELLALAYEFLDLLAAGSYAEAFEQFGYAMAYQFPEMPGGEAIRLTLAECQPDSRVTDWRVAPAISETSRCRFVHYAPNNTGLVSALSVVLPLNGEWSEVSADFVVTKSDAGYHFSLEDIYSNAAGEA